MNRVSKVSVETALERFLTDDLRAKIMEDIEYWDRREAETEVGMLYGDWARRFDEEDFDVVWAADSGAGFGEKGWTVYGDCDNMRIVKITKSGHKKTLHLWYDGRDDWRD